MLSSGASFVGEIFGVNNFMAHTPNGRAENCNTNKQAIHKHQTFTLTSNANETIFYSLASHPIRMMTKNMFARVRHKFRDGWRRMCSIICFKEVFFFWPKLFCNSLFFNDLLETVVRPKITVRKLFRTILIS